MRFDDLPDAGASSFTVTNLRDSPGFTVLGTALFASDGREVGFLSCNTEGAWVLTPQLGRVGEHGLLGRLSRSLGLAALVFVAPTLPAGLLFGRQLVAADRRREVRALHMTLSLSALTVTALHSVTLLGATALGPDVARLLVSTLWPYQHTVTALGVMSVYVLVLLGPTYYARRTLGLRRWRIAHRFIAVGLALAILTSSVADRAPAFRGRLV